MNTASRHGRAWLGTGVLLSLALAYGLTGAPVSAQQDPTDYEGQVEVVRGVRGQANGDETARGYVFHDANRDSRSQRSEVGVAGVMVSNGRDVVLTDADGAYQLPAYENMTLFVTKPAGYDVPVDEHHFPQFFYHHLPNGSPDDLQFPGIPPTGPLPSEVNFPLAPAPYSGDDFSCAVIGDSQTYSNRELGYLRDGVVEDIAARDDLDQCGALMLGDLLGDDLGLYPRFKEVMSQADVPVRAVPGNHDLNFDADTDAHSFDTYRDQIGPAYYSFDVGDVHFVGLDNVRYPCTPDDNTDGQHGFCENPEDHPDYNGVIDDQQMEWLENDLALVPDDKLVVVATHIPLVSYIDMYATKHQTDNATELYDLLEGREALSISGHTHTLENLSAGESYEGWQETVGVESLPFPHVVAGAASGSWWGGDLDADGIPMAFAREGTPGGYATFDFSDSTFTNSFDVTPLGDDQHMALSLNTPHFREWAQALRDFNEASDSSEDTPPVNINDLGDPNLVVSADLGESWLVANVWNGTAETEVTVHIDDRAPVTAERTQQGRGEGILEGLEYADPFAMTRQLQVARTAFVSASGNERAQGYERFQGAKFGPADPRPEDEGTDQSMHLWTLPLPTDLQPGAHTATVHTTDPRGGEHVQVLTFEVYDERPPSFFRTEVFADDEG